jgi:hypothetical protein
MSGNFPQRVKPRQQNEGEGIVSTHRMTLVEVSRHPLAAFGDLCQKKQPKRGRVSTISVFQETSNFINLGLLRMSKTQTLRFVLSYDA